MFVNVIEWGLLEKPNSVFNFLYRFESMQFEFKEDRGYFERLLCKEGEELERYETLFDFRLAIVKRKEFNSKRKSLVEKLLSLHGRDCMLKYECCDLSSGLTVDHLIPLSTNKLNKELRKFKPESDKKVTSQSFGSNHIDNLVIACAKCNSHKNHKILEAELFTRIFKVKKRIE